MKKLCRTCKHWDTTPHKEWPRRKDAVQEFPCEKIEEHVEVMLNTYGWDCSADVDTIDTKPNFGCILWEQLATGATDEC